MTQPYDLITELPQSVTNNPLWAGSSMNLNFRNHQLTHEKLAFWLKNFSRIDDATPNEQAMFEALNAFHSEWLASWEF